MLYDLIIIGSGAAGLSAGIYAGRYKLKTLLIRGDKPGGETAIASIIENYPGFKSIDGFELMQRMEEQAKEWGIEFVDGLVEKVKRENHCFFIKTKDNIFKAKSIILAMGSQRRRLNLPREKELTGKGISYCATCDSPLYRGQVVGVVGGGDAATKGAALASEYASLVYLLVRSDALGAEPVNLEKIKRRSNIIVLFETEVETIIGEKKLEKVILSKEFKGTKELSLDGLFVEIGALPRSDLAKMLGVKLNEQGYIEVDKFMRTNIEGVLAAGDITDASGDFRQDITAAAQGAIAATWAYKYISVKGELCELHSRAVGE